MPSDERTVNRLFVSAYIECNGLPHPKSEFLSGYLIADGDAEFGKLQDLCSCLKGEYTEGNEIETLVKLFEYVVSPADRIVTGAVYTPQSVRKAILQRCLGNKKKEELEKLRISDISCGCGGFLMDAARWIHGRTDKAYADIFRDNIFGIDLQAYSIERTKILLSLLALGEKEDVDFEFNLLCRDTLDFKTGDWDDTYSGFDVVVGNPPYVCSRNLPYETRNKLKAYEVCQSGHPDLYIPFLQIGAEMLKEEGLLGYITMNTFLRSINGRALRKYLSDGKSAISIVDFRGYQVFDSKDTYTCLFFMDKSDVSTGIKYAVDEDGKLYESIHFGFIPYANLDDVKGWTLNDFNTTTSIEATGIQIKDYCPSRHGIATLSNKTYIFRPVKEDIKYYYKEDSGKYYPIEKNICRNVVNPNRLNSSANFDELIEKVIFPYRVESGKATVIEPEIMRNDYPCTWEYLKVNKEVLLKRDKGNTRPYPQWYAFGRTQSLVMPKYKLFFPKFANRSLRCVISGDAELLLYNGLAFVSDDIKKLEILKAFIESELFWSYVKKNGKPYASGYYSLSGVDIKHFGIPRLTRKQERELLQINSKEEKEEWIRQYYNTTTL